VDIIARAGGGRLSAASDLETAIVIDRARPGRQSRPGCIPGRPRHKHRGGHAGPGPDRARGLARFRQGSGDPAQLNFGDCLSYALATEVNQPILFKRRFLPYRPGGRDGLAGAPALSALGSDRVLRLAESGHARFERNTAGEGLVAEFDDQFADEPGAAEITNMKRRSRR
jgi:ribonuclease VapC